ncbi:SdpI family protein [Bacteroidota bacterium]
METKDFVKKEWVLLVLMIIPFIMIALFWDDFPAKIPTHWNFSGEIDQYTSKEIGLFLVPGLNIIFYIMFYLLPRIDPRKGNYKLFRTSYNILRHSIIGFLFLMFILLFFSGLGHELNIGFIVINLTLILFLIIGNFMGKIKSNYFLGIRTPWTLENPDNWNKTHRLAGKIWVWLSLIMIILSFLIPMNILTIVYFIYIAIIVLVPFVYSYILHVKK